MSELEALGNMQPSLDLQFSLTKQEAEIVLNAVAALPYIQVAALIQKLQAQAQACIEQAKEEPNG